MIHNALFLFSGAAGLAAFHHAGAAGVAVALMLCLLLAAIAMEDHPDLMWPAFAIYACAVCFPPTVWAYGFIAAIGLVVALAGAALALFIGIQKIPNLLDVLALRVVPQAKTDAFQRAVAQVVRDGLERRALSARGNPDLEAWTGALEIYTYRHPSQGVDVESRGPLKFPVAAVLRTPATAQALQGIHQQAMAGMAWMQRRLWTRALRQRSKWVDSAPRYSAHQRLALAHAPTAQAPAATRHSAHT